MNMKRKSECKAKVTAWWFQPAYLLTFLLLSVASGLSAQADLSDPRLEGLDLEFHGHTVSPADAEVYYDLTYWRLFASHQKGWLGGDGVYTTTLPDGNIFWSFGDSFFGLGTEFRNNGRPTNLPRNAAMIQTGEHSFRDFIVLNELCSTNPNDRDRYYKGKTWLRHPDAMKLSQSEINDGGTDSDHFYWPGDGSVIKREGKPILQLIWGSIFGNMESDGRVIAEYSLEGEPGSPDYMKLLRVIDYKGNDVTKTSGTYWPGGYGSAILEDADGHNYLYSSIGTSYGLGAIAIVARSATHDITSEWEYWIADADGNFSWQKEIPTTEEKQRSGISNGDWVTEPSVFKYGDKYYMCTQVMTNSPIYIMQADNPWGPFTNRKNLYTVPQKHNATYNVFVHPQLSRTGELVISYNMNPDDLSTYTRADNGDAIENKINGFWRNFNAWGSSDLYQPHFIRVFNWQKLYGIENIGPITDVGITEYEKMK